ncbi:putative WD40/YVTN repeat-like-containing domain, WD40 repeat protein [Pseudoloma neurophilia]|uniref:Putative WD40/YVTN repeat-like-containing domain, WD40 repeat protein n=1 Tax=Pseudoloma neurophilia TaxID=146866 RepID=A0A0R0M642_9MICR|nr:putative WD40/YVTN repeat-like-containing domain, WD40 repeat protein [Pseudoloma neurophilia]
MVFQLSMVVPVSSTARGLIKLNENIIFAASNSLYQLKKNQIVFLISLHGQIEEIFYDNGFLYARTNSMFYMLKNDKIVATMNVKTDFSFTVLDNTALIGDIKKISQYLLPTEFKPLPFERIANVTGHSNGTTKLIPLPEENMVLSYGNDCTIRLNSVQHGKYKTFIHFTEEPIGLFYEKLGLRSDDLIDLDKLKENEINTSMNIQIDLKNQFNLLNLLKYNYKFTAISSEGKVFTYSTEKNNLESRLYLNIPILAAAQRQDLFFLLSDEKKVYVVRNEQYVCFKIDEKGYEILANENDIFIRGENFLNQYHCTNAQIEDAYFKKIAAKQQLNNDKSDVIDSLLLVSPIPLPKIIDFAYNEDLAVASDDNLIIKYKMGPDHILVKSFFDTEEKIAKVFFKKNVILTITESSKVKAFDTVKSVKFRDIQLEQDILCADTNDDNSLLVFCDNTNFHMLDIRTSKILESIGVSAPVTKVCVVNNSIFCLLVSNTVLKYEILTRKYNVFDSKTTIFNIFASNQKMILSSERSLAINSLNMETEKLINCSFRSRSRNEMGITDKPVTALSISFDGRLMICGGRSNELRVYDILTGVILKSIKLSRNKELENYKKKLGREKKTEYIESNVIESLKIEYLPNGFIIFSREGISVFKTPDFIKKPVLDSFVSKKEISSLISQEKWQEAFENIAISQNTEDLSLLVSRIPENSINSVIKSIISSRECKSVICKLLLQNFDPKVLLCYNKIIFHHPGNLIDDDILLMKMLQDKYKQITK